MPRVAIPCVAAGAVIALSLPPWGWWPLGFAGAAILYWRLAGMRIRTRLLAGWLAGLGCYVPGLWWARSFNWYGAVVLMAVEALSMGVAAALVPPRRGRLLAYAGAFTLLEAVRMTWPFGGLPIGGVFLGQADGPFLGTARIGGPLLITGVVWLGGAGLCELATQWSATVRVAAVSEAGSGIEPATEGRGRSATGNEPTRVRSRPIFASTAAGAVALVVVLAIGVAGAGAPDGGKPVRLLEVAAVQGGGRRGTTAEEVNPSIVFSAQLAATSLIERQDHGRTPRLVVWPEDVIALSRPLAGSPQAATMAELARRLHATVIAGVTEPVSDTAFRNMAVVWGPSGQVVGTYEKVHRVPFGEYVPYRGFFAHFATLSAVPLTAVPGHGSGMLRTPAGPLGVMISYEVFYSDRSRPSVGDGAELLVVPTNTSSYNASQIPTQEVAADRVQAVEEGRDLVQAAPTGYSSVVDNRGNVFRRSVLGRRQVLLATVGLRTGRTVFARFGSLPILVLAGLVLVIGWMSAAPWSARRRSGYS